MRFIRATSFAVLALVGAAGDAGAAAVSWTGAGDGTSWSDPANWSSNPALPGAADDVVISVAANPTIVISGVNPSIRSLNSAETIDLRSSSTLTVGVGGAMMTAPLVLTSGALSGGTWTFSGPGNAIMAGASNSNAITNCAVTGELLVAVANGRCKLVGTTNVSAVHLGAASAGVGLPPGVAIGFPIIADGTQNGARVVELSAPGTLTIGPGGSVSGGGSWTGTLQVGSLFWFSAATVTTNQGSITLSGAARTLEMGGQSVVNAAGGTIGVSGGATLTMDVTGTNTNSITNSGLITATDATMTLLDLWTNAGGTITINNSTLSLDGSFTTAAIGAINRTGGSVLVKGAWNNTASAFTFNAATGSWTLSGGTVTGGTINAGGAQGLGFAALSTNNMNGVAYNGDAIVSVSSGRFRVGTGTTFSAIRLQSANSAVSFAPGYTLTYPVICEGSASGARAVDVASAGGLTIGPAGSISAAGTWTGTVDVGGGFYGSAANPLVNQGGLTVGGAGRTLAIGGQTFSNEASGAIQVSGGAAVTIDVNGTNTNAWSNAGTFSVDGGTLTVSDLWSATADISTTNTTVNLGGQFTTAAARRIVRSGGTVSITGLLDNTGDTFALNATTGPWRLNGGTVLNGTVTTSGANALVFAASGTNRLTGVTYPGELLVDQNNGRVGITGGSFASVRLASVNAGVAFASGTVITFPIVSDLTTTATQAVECIAGGGTLTVGPGGSITSAPGSLSSIKIGGFWFQAPAVFVNQGLISSSAAAATLTISPGGFTNSGMVRGRNNVTVTVTGLSGNAGSYDIADAGTSLSLDGNYALTGTLSVGSGTTATLLGTWTNSGTIMLDNGTLDLGGTFTTATFGTFTRNGGTININGTFDNTGGNFTFNSSTGSWRLNGGTVRGGTINFSGGNRLTFSTNSQSTVTDVAFTSELVDDTTNGRVKLTGTTTAPSYRLSAVNAGLAFPPGTVLNTTITVDGPAGGREVDVSGPGSFTIGPSGRIQGVAAGVGVTVGEVWYAGPMTLTNQGVIDVAGSILVNATTLTNFDSATGTLTGGTWIARGGAALNVGRTVLVNNATVVLDGVGGSGFTDMRTNLGSYTLANNRDVSQNASVTAFTNAGLLSLGAGCRMTIGSVNAPATFAQAGTGTLDIKLGGTSNLTGYGNLRVFGDVALDGVLHAEYINGFARACGQSFDIIDGDGERTGIFSDFQLPPPTPENKVIVFGVGADLTAVVTSVADFNNDGFVDFFDIDEFVAAFEAGDMSADFNGDEFLDFFDFDAFVFAFEAGC